MEHFITLSSIMIGIVIAVIVVFNFVHRRTFIKVVTNMFMVGLAAVLGAALGIFGLEALYIPSLWG